MVWPIGLRTVDRIPGLPLIVCECVRLEGGGGFLSDYYIQWRRDEREEGRLGRDRVMGGRGNRVGELPISLATGEGTVLAA